MRLRIAEHRAQPVYGGGAVIVTSGSIGDTASHSVLVRVEYADAAYGDAAFERLRALKTRYDPTNVLRRNQNIPPL